jgi:tetratricopeptide (TPR) repeat protein
VTAIDKHITWAELVITGEGKLDRQSRFMKAPAVLAAKARRAQKPVIALCGTFMQEAVKDFDEVVAICIPPVTLKESLENAALLVENASEKLAFRQIINSGETNDYHHRLVAIDKMLSENLTENAAELLKNADGASLGGYWYLKGLFEQKFHRWGNAINHYRRCLELDPGNLKAAAGIEMCRNILNFWNPQQFNP